jgi:hypothetical protein
VIEAHRALRLTPQDLGALVRQVTDAAQQQGRRELANAVQLVNAAAAEMNGLVQGERAGRDQDRWLAIAGGIGLIVGMILWACFSGPIARALLAAWSVPEKMASRDVAAGPLGGRLPLDGDAGLARVGESRRSRQALPREQRGARRLRPTAARAGEPQPCKVIVAASAGRAAQSSPIG